MESGGHCDAYPFSFFTREKELALPSVYLHENLALPSTIQIRPKDCRLDDSARWCECLGLHGTWTGARNKYTLKQVHFNLSCANLDKISEFDFS